MPIYVGTIHLLNYPFVISTVFIDFKYICSLHCEAVDVFQTALKECGRWSECTKAEVVSQYGGRQVPFNEMHIKIHL